MLSLFWQCSDNAVSFSESHQRICIRLRSKPYPQSFFSPSSQQTQSRHNVTQGSAKRMGFLSSHYLTQDVPGHCWSKNQTLRCLPSNTETSKGKSISICLPTPCPILMLCYPVEDHGSQSGHTLGPLLLPPDLRNNSPICLLLTQENRGDSRSSGQKPSQALARKYHVLD